MGEEPLSIAPMCKWHHDADIDVWHTECGEFYQFTTDGPDENKARFCQYCGGRLVVVRQEADRG